YYTGGIAERPIDLRLPSYGGIRFQQVRHYNQRQSSTLQTEQGNNWTYTYWAHLEQGTGSVVNYVKNPHRSYSYTVSSDATFCWEDNMRIRSRLIHKHAKDETADFGVPPAHDYRYKNMYRLQKPNGAIWYFYDFSVNWDAKIRGKLAMIVGV